MRRHEGRHSASHTHIRNRTLALHSALRSPLHLAPPPQHWVDEFARQINLIRSVIVAETAGPCGRQRSEVAWRHRRQPGPSLTLTVCQPTHLGQSWTISAHSSPSRLAGQLLVLDDSPPAARSTLLLDTPLLASAHRHHRPPRWPRHTPSPIARPATRFSGHCTPIHPPPSQPGQPSEPFWAARAAKRSTLTGRAKAAATACACTWEWARAIDMPCGMWHARVKKKGSRPIRGATDLRRVAQSKQPTGLGELHPSGKPRSPSPCPTDRVQPSAAAPRGTYDAHPARH